MGSLIGAAAFFLLVHVGASDPRVRTALIRQAGHDAYRWLLGLASLFGLLWLGLAYATTHVAYAAGRDWRSNPLLEGASTGVNLLAALLFFPALLTPNPALFAPDQVEPRGMLRVSRHPGLWGVVLWSAEHLLLARDVATALLFAPLLIAALLGVGKLDARCAARLGERWPAFRDATSSVPFAAILAGRQKLSVREIGPLRIGAALAAFALLAWLHPHLFGAPALGLRAAAGSSGPPGALEAAQESVMPNPADPHEKPYASENANLKPGETPRPATEPDGAHGSTQTPKTRTDPATGAPTGGTPEAGG